MKRYKYVPSIVGVPQGGIISPLLSNLILHELDSFVDEYIAKCESLRENQKKSLTNPTYMRAARAVKNLRKELLTCKKGGTEYKLIKHKIRKALVIQRSINSLIHHPKILPTIKYVRYADDWLIGV